MNRLWFSGSLGAAILLALAGGFAASPATANNADPNQGPCEEYGRLLTAHVAPTAQMGTNAYRSIYFPARDQCLNVSGPRYMPNGYAASPHFRPPAVTTAPPPPPPSNPTAPPPTPTSTPGSTPVPTPINPNQAACEEYGRLLTAHVAPAAQMGTHEYRSVYFPARDQCLNVGGPRFMPNGLAASPYYRPPATTAGGNPPPPTSTGGTSGPSSPGGNPPTPVTSPQQAAAALNRTLPAGLSYVDAVQWALVGCNIYSNQAAYAAGPTGSPQFTQAGTAAAQTCMSRGGQINGQFYNPPSPVMLVAMRAAYTKSQACQSWEGQPGVSVCVNDRGEWTTCYQGNCYASAPPAWVTAEGPSQGTTNFFSCAGGSCLRGPRVDDPRNYPPPPAERPFANQRFKPVRDAMDAECRQATTAVDRYFCGFQICMRQQTQAGVPAQVASQHCEAALLEITGQSFDQMLAALLPTLSQATAAAMTYARNVLAAKFADPLFKDQIRAIMKQQIAGPAIKIPSANVWLKGLGIPSTLGFIQDFFMGVMLRARALADPCGAGLLPPQACGGITAVTVLTPSKSRGAVGSTDSSAASLLMDIATSCRAAYVKVRPWRQVALPADVERRLQDAFVEDCTANAPSISHLRGIMTQLLANCLGNGNGSSSDIVSWSAGANACLWQVYGLAPKNSPWLDANDVRAGTQGLSTWLAGCSRLAGAEWVGTGHRGRAQPLAGTPPPPMPQFLATVRGCMNRIPILIQ